MNKQILIRSLETVSHESTCHKRVTICEIQDINGVILSRESNRCDPSGGYCGRIGVVQSKENYDTESTCNWTHAEIRAIAALPEGAKPHRSIIYGHAFYCNDCESALRNAGVQILDII